MSVAILALICSVYNNNILPMEEPFYECLSASESSNIFFFIFPMKSRWEFGYKFENNGRYILNKTHSFNMCVKSFKLQHIIADMFI